MSKEIVYMVGLPGSGKSSYIQKHFPNHVVISNDIIVEEYGASKGLCYNDAWKEISFSYVTNECLRRFNHAVKVGKNIVIDNTNMTPKARKKYIASGYIRKAVVFRLPEDEYAHRVLKRRNETGKLVPENAIHQMKKIFQMPTKQEGFEDIVLITS